MGRIGRVAFLARIVTVAGAFVACEGTTSTGPDEWTDLDSMAGQFVASCEQRRALVRFVYENKSCSTDTECVHAGDCLDSREHCGGGFYVGGLFNQTEFEMLDSAAAQCGLTTPCCGSVPPTQGACLAKRCFPGTSDANRAAGCMDAMGEASDCAACICHEESVNASACALDPSCAPIFVCARKVGCLGTLDCDLASAAFPCKAEVNAAGGPKSPIATKYRESNIAASRLGCDAVCGG